MDVLSEVLRAVRLTGAVYFDMSARQPWCSLTPPMGKIGSTVMPEAEHVIPFHLMISGWCWAELADGSLPAARMDTGDILLFPRGDAHVMGSIPGERPEANLKVYADAAKSRAPYVFQQIGGDGDETRFVCGYLGCDASPFNPLLASLPKMLLVKAPADRRDSTIELMLAALDESESKRAGAETVLAKLSELMFVTAMRRYIESLPEDSIGWLPGLRDRHVGAALHLIHTQAAANWTLGSLAQSVGMSRSAFAERFTQYVHVSPMHYLGLWRMQLASRALERPGTSIAQVAEAVGYESEAAFHRAFKKHVGSPPGAWRRAHPAGPVDDMTA